MITKRNHQKVAKSRIHEKRFPFHIRVWAFTQVWTVKKEVGLNIPVSIICLIRISDLILRVNKQMTAVDPSGAAFF